MKDITNQRKRKNSFIIFYFLKLMVKKKKKISSKTNLSDMAMHAERSWSTKISCHCT